MVTNITAVRGIGNRPGYWNFLSNSYFPYGKRRMALPVWAHARGKLYDTVVMQDGTARSWLGFHEASRRPSPYYCRPLDGAARTETSTPSPARRGFNSAKGKLTHRAKSYYPPRNDLTRFISNDCDVAGASCPLPQRDAARRAQRSGRGGRGDARLRRAFSGHLDGSGRSAGGRLRAGVEVNKEFDNNASHNHPSYEDPRCPTTA